MAVQAGQVPTVRALRTLPIFCPNPSSRVPANDLGDVFGGGG